MNKKARKRLGALQRLMDVAGHQHKTQLAAKASSMTAEEIDEVTKVLVELGGYDLAVKLAKRDNAYVLLRPLGDAPGWSFDREDGLRLGWFRIKGWRIWTYVRCEAPAHKVTWHEWRKVRFTWKSLLGRKP